MKRFLTLAAMGAALTLAACDQPEPSDEGLEPSPPVEVAPVPVETPPVETAPAPTTPTDSTALPTDERTSEETVRPDSETLFY
ncbi:MAG: hypothetical protein KJ676_02325 [Alphaproteobacteria bacterium]|nr:hypothetical protein [Alphaproteobacteria bacterium]MBU1524864.1 hypothetical protein [Alphaproteobacteria bacterium]MBU2117245.1 hypothetical protein [Alphaproteobacteria bacterium]MBU2350153.1 hypothetical protein [Alphaproteobacteria bacterium]MBU2381954.1 hypothetical protein [Alphaproteobacteria bacterium]